MAFSPDGQQLATAGRDHLVRIWDARPLSPEVLWQREARGLVEFLSTQTSASDPIARVRDDVTISEPVRQRALALLQWEK